MADDIPYEELARQASFMWRPPPDPEWMTRAEVAQLGRVSGDTVDKLVQDGVLAAYRIGRSGNLRFKRKDVQASLFQRVQPNKARTTRKD